MKRLDDALKVAEHDTLGLARGRGRLRSRRLVHSRRQVILPKLMLKWIPRRSEEQKGDCPMVSV